MIWKIDKTFEFCYGHRVHSQVLDKPEYSINTMCKCRHLHGHQGTVKLGLEGSKLKDGMITDFHNLNWFKQWIDTVLDHKFIIDKSDPLITTLIPGYVEEPFNADTTFQICQVEDVTEEMSELYGSFVIVDFVPTSENLARWIYNMAMKKMAEINIRVSFVDFWETPKSHVRYEG